MEPTKTKVSPDYALTEARLGFMNGYLVAFLQEMHTRVGEVEGGLYQYYVQRYSNLKIGLLLYERHLTHYIDASIFKGARILHVGIGCGTLTSTLYSLDFNITGIEADGMRHKLAVILQERMKALFNSKIGAYDVVNGYFPTVLTTKLAGQNFNVLLMTNLGAGLSDDVQSAIVALFPNFGHVILDLRLFGRTRESGEERAALGALIAATNPREIRSLAMGGPGIQTGTDYVHVMY